NAQFLDTIRESLNNSPQPDVVLGDFNMVEDTLDRLPHKSDPVLVSNAMFEFKHSLNICDGWRQTFPDTLQYTYLR
ncbi:hypothetical protein B0H13DRAFT_1623042, partial [Mycena leptocephala]